MVSPVSRSELLEDLRRVADELGEPPSGTQYDEHGDYSESSLYREFGSIPQAREQAGLDSSDQRGGHNEISREELLQSIHDLREQLGHVPRREEMLEHGDYSEGPFRREFGSWGEAVTAAGYEPYRPSSDLADRILVKCAQCGTEEQVLASQNNKQKRWFCSRECSGAWRAENIVGENHHQYQRVTAACDWCGDEIKRKPAVAEKKERAFCDTECYSKWCSHERTGEDNPRYAGGDEVTECDYCGEEYTVRPAKLDSSRFCSYDCLGKWRQETGVYSGENNPNWEGGYEPYYGPNWAKQRSRALQRDDWTCQDCGMVAEESELEHGQELSVHHRIPLRQFVPDNEEPDYESANALDNLITLCVSCHRKWEPLPVQPDVG